MQEKPRKLWELKGNIPVEIELLPKGDGLYWSVEKQKLLDTKDGNVFGTEQQAIEAAIFRGEAVLKELQKILPELKERLNQVKLLPCPKCCREVVLIIVDGDCGDEGHIKCMCGVRYEGLISEKKWGRNQLEIDQFIECWNDREDRSKEKEQYKDYYPHE